MNFPRTRPGFTLIELLVVIGIVSVLSVVVVLVLNPAELLKQSRDSIRLSDITSMQKGISLLRADGSGIDFSAANTVYVSLSDSTTTCANLGLPALPDSWSYACVSSSTLRQVGANGWLPLNFSSASFQAPFSSLPIDPTNSTSTDSYYTYVASSSRIEMTAKLESRKYQSKYLQDGGQDIFRYQAGDALDLTPIPNLSLWLKADAITDTSDGSLIAQWNDSNLGQNNVTQSSGSRQPIYKTGIVNGKPVVRFDGEDDFLESSNDITIGTAFLVVNYTGGANFQNYSGALSQRTTNATIFRGESGSTLWRSNGAANTLDGYFGDNIFVNGQQTKNMSPLSTFKIVSGFPYNSVPTTYTGVEIGRYTSNDTLAWAGDFAEIMIFSKVLTATERQEVETYLNDKYGLF